MKFNYIIYHKNCLDGFTGFFLFKRLNLCDKNTFIFPDIPSAKSVPPNIKNKNIIIIDVAYSKEILEKIFQLANHVTFIDHHITVKDYSKILGDKYNHQIVFNEKFSGCGLVWKYFYQGEKMPKFVKYIQDNDTGTWKIKYTREFISAIQVNYKLVPYDDNIKIWEKMFDKKEIRNLIKLGIKYEEHKNYLLIQNSKRYSIESFPSETILNKNNNLKNLLKYPNKYKIIVHNGNCPSVSSLGDYFMTNMNCDFVWIWTLNLERKEIVVSLRSKDNGVDVSKIAECFGGGGHHSASAFSFNIRKLDLLDFFGENSIPR